MIILSPPKPTEYRKKPVNHIKCFKNEWIYTPASQYTFIVCTGVLPANFTFTCHATYFVKCKEELAQGLACFGSDFGHVVCEIFFIIRIHLYYVIRAYLLLRDSV